MSFRKDLTQGYGFFILLLFLVCFCISNATHYEITLQSLEYLSIEQWYDTNKCGDYSSCSSDNILLSFGVSIC